MTDKRTSREPTEAMLNASVKAYLDYIWDLGTSIKTAMSAAWRAMHDTAPDVPIDMVLHCPKCGKQHIDEPEQNDRFLGLSDPPAAWAMPPWTNPPHRSHLCCGCGHIWRPADVATNGVAAIKTKGKADSKIAATTEVYENAARFLHLLKEWRITLHVAFFGNGCVNTTNDMVIAAIDAERKGK